MAHVVKPISIEQEYEKNPDISPEDIRKLRDWLSTQPHLPGEHFTDVDLLVVFHCCDKSFEVAKQVLDLHYSLRTSDPFFGDFGVDKNIELSINNVLCTPLGTPTAEGYRVVYFKLLDYDPRKYNFKDSIKVFTMIFDLWQYEEGTWPGFVLIVDMEGSALGHLSRVDLSDLRKTLHFLQECMFVRLKGFHFMNAPNFIDKLIMLIKPFLKKDLFDQIHFHTVGSNAIYKSIPKESFPKEKGGNYKDYKTIQADLLEHLRINTKFFEEERKKRVNEKLRVGENPAKIGQGYGLQGSFKKLELD